MHERLAAFGLGHFAKRLRIVLSLFSGFACLAIPIYLVAGLGEWSVTLFDSPKNLLLVVGFLFVPAIAEELVWRWLLIPPSAFESRRVAVVSVLLTAVLATVAHPMAAWLFVPHAWELFTKPAFLLIVLLLGVTCGMTYTLSRSIWAPVVLHWLTVVAWKFFFGGPFVLLGR